MPDIPTPDGAPAPEPTPAPDFGGASPEVISQALDLYNGLNNLDTRGQYLQQVVRPEYDGQFLRQMAQPEAEQAEDPWAAYNQQYAEPEYEQQYEPQAPAFDPTTLPQMLEPRFEAERERIVKEVFGQLNQMAQDQAVRDSAGEAARAMNLPPAMSSLIEQQVREQQQLHPNRQASDLAREAATALSTQLLQWKATPPANPAPTSAVPGGPAPDTLQKPRTIEEAMEYSKQVLNP